MLNRGRLRTVAYAIQNRVKDSDPGFDMDRYAVRKRLEKANEQDVPLSGIDRTVDADIAAWTCFEYPYLCNSVGMEYYWNQGLCYYENAKRILGLSEEQADKLFVWPKYNLEDTRNDLWAIAALNTLASGGEIQCTITRS